jgi:hypothetical protein
VINSATPIDSGVERYLAEHLNKTPDPATPVMHYPKFGLPGQSNRLVVAGVAAINPEIEKLLRKLEAPFSETLFRLIDRSGKSDAEVYKRANIDRRLFSKIRSKKNYSPSKQTVLALAVALELPLDDTLGLLGCAGLTLSHNSVFDVIVEYFIVSGNYEIEYINDVLGEYDQQLLGGRI